MKRTIRVNGNTIRLPKILAEAVERVSKKHGGNVELAVEKILQEGVIHLKGKSE